MPKHLYTAGDGYCYNAVWPMWSELLALAMDCKWTNLSMIGIGNEAIANLVLDALPTADPDSVWIIQWTNPTRLDLRVDPIRANQALLETINQDPIYYKNFITTAKDRTYWASSESQLDLVNEYRQLIPLQQHRDRTSQLQLAVAYALEQRGVDWTYIFNYPSDWVQDSLLPTNRVIYQPLSEFRKISKYAELDVGDTQPVSSIHLDFLEQFIFTRYPVDLDRVETIKKEILKQDRARKNGPGLLT
jgi:hypothetical protein